MKKAHLVFPILLLILSAVLIVGYVSYIDQTHEREKTMDLVSDAVTLIKTEGTDAFSEFRKKDSKWFYDDTYVFVWQTDGIRLVYPPDLSGEGQNVSTLVDVNGKAIGKLFIDVALSEDGEGWVDYSWPKPGETEPSVKRTYIKGFTLDEQVLLVGSGFYADTIVNEIEPLQYVAILMESIIAGIGLLLAIRKKRFFGYGIFLTFAIYVFYDLVKLMQLEVSDIILYPMFFVATLSILWAIILIYKEK